MLGQQYDSMDCKPYSTAKYYEAYRPDVPGLVPVCLRAAVDILNVTNIVARVQMRHEPNISEIRRLARVIT